MQIVSKMTQPGNRKVAIAVDLSDESAYAVGWSVANYLRPDDSVILLHVQTTSILYGADWGATNQSIDTSDEETPQSLESDFDALTLSKVTDLAKPISDAKIPFKIHIVKDHDMKERVCLEVERLGVNAVIMGSRGFGASRKPYKARLGSVSDYCVHHCECPVVVVRFPEDEKEGGVSVPGLMAAADQADHNLEKVDSPLQNQTKNGVDEMQFNVTAPLSASYTMMQTRR